MKERAHTRCPVCSRLAPKGPGELLPGAFNTEHPIDGMVQRFPGGGRSGKGRGFQWEHRDLSVDEIAALETIVSGIAARLRGELGDDGSDTETVSTDEGLRAEVDRWKREAERLRRSNQKLRKFAQLATRAIADAHAARR